MRGKYKSSAEARQAREEFERRAIAAEERAGKAEKALADLKESAADQLARLRADLASVVRDRDLGAAPALMEAEQRIRELIKDRDDARHDAATLLKKWRTFADQVIAILHGMGLKNTEAMEVLIASINPSKTTRTYTGGIDGKLKGLDTDDVMAIQRARGKRSRVDPLAAVERNTEPQDVAQVIRDEMSPGQIAELIQLLDKRADEPV